MMQKYILPSTLIATGALLIGHWSNQQKPNYDKLVIPPTQASPLPFIKTASSTQPSTNAIQKPLEEKIQNSNLEKKKSISFDQPYSYFQQRLQKLKECFRIRNCNYPQTDPKSYELALEDDVVATLKTLRAWIQRHSYVDDRIPLFMKEFLPFESANIKNESLRILRTQPPNDELIEPILLSVILYYHPESIELGMKELLRHEKPEFRTRMDDVFTSVLLNGSVNAAVEIAKSLAPFIESHNRRDYQWVLKKLSQSPINDEITEALESHLQKK